MIIHRAFSFLFLSAIAVSAFAAEPSKPESAKGSGSTSPLEAALLGKDASQAADLLEKMYEGTRQPESVRMLIAILRGSQMGPGEGWFGPAQSRYDWQWLAKACDMDPAAKGGISRDKFPGNDRLFARLNRSKNGQITRDDLDWSDRNPWVMQSVMVNRLFRRMDAKADGKLTEEEVRKFFEKVAHEKDYVTADDLRDALIMGPGGFAPGDAPKTDVLIRALFAGEIGSMNEGPQLDQPAPNFTLATPDGKEHRELSRLMGQKPVVLVFGNFTCGPFRALYPDVESVYERWKNEANFLMVYVREAHPTTGWKMESNSKAGVEVEQPSTFEQRCQVAGKFSERFKPAIPVVVDEMNDVVGHAYSGMPARLYVIDKHGKIAYKSGRGPFGFRVGEMEQALIMTLLDDKPAKKPEADDRQSARFPQLSNDEALKKLPGAEGHLPAWALTLVESSPRTTAAMLELDYLHRAKNPLGEVLAAKIRWTAADALDSSYGKRTAEADLRRAGVKDDEIRELTSNRKTSPADASVLAFCRKLTTAGHSLTDEEVADLVKQFGTEKVMAMAHTVAFANFENRIFLGLGLEVERDGPLPPIEVQFDKDALTKIEPPERPALDKAQTSDVRQIGVKPEWRGYADVEKALAAQKSRKPRIQPADEERLAQLSPEARKRVETTKVLWTRLSVGYQPALTLSWLGCLSTWHDEAKLDAVFANSMFWVVTRSNECFY